MNVTREVLHGIGVAERPEELDMIRRPDVAATIWRRRPLRSFQNWIDGLDPAQLPRTRVTLRPGDTRRTISQVCENAGTPHGPGRTRLIDDVAALADIFAGLMRTPFLRLRLDVVRSNACRKFHIDAVTARLVCTYRGTGTQYGRSTDGTDPARIFTVPTGTPIILRGTQWRGPHPGVLHRSPPIEGSGETRLLLVLDPVHNPEGAA